MKPLYLDYAASTPCDPEVAKIVYDSLIEDIGNPSSNSFYADKLKHKLSKASEEIANYIGGEDKSIIYTSGSTEAINLAIKGFYNENYHEDFTIVSSKLEHKAVLNSLNHLSNYGANVFYVNHNTSGEIDYDHLTQLLKEGADIVCLSAINNETGIINDLSFLGKLVKEYNSTFFCDASQAIGKIDIDVTAMNIDMLAFSGHKIYAPKGIGLLYKKQDVKILPELHGGEQQNNLRSGTLNSTGILALQKAISLLNKNEQKYQKNALNNKEKIIKAFRDNELGEIASISKKICPNIIPMRLYNQASSDFIMRKKALATFSNGSACNSRIEDLSHVYKELGWDESIIRISVPVKEELDYDLLVKIFN